MSFSLDVAFDLDLTLCCGQVFRWRKLDGWWYSVVDGTPFKIRQVGYDLEFDNVNEEYVRNYFGLNDNLNAVCQVICHDEVTANALQRFEGLRIIRQNPWECLISFICATYKSISAIELMLSKMSEKFGEKILYDGREFYKFPTVEQLANASDNGLRECGLGYRAKYIQATAKKISQENLDLNLLKDLPYLEAKKRLLEFPGVGLKVADCVLLFSLEKLDAFPVDVWVKRILLKYYSQHFPEDLVKKLSSHDSLTNTEYEQLSSFARWYFGGYAGYAQEYLYHNERTKK